MSNIFNYKGSRDNAERQGNIQAFAEQGGDRMKKNYGRKQRRRLNRLNRRQEGRNKARDNERAQKEVARCKKSIAL